MIFTHDRVVARERAAAERGGAPAHGRRERRRRPGETEQGRQHQELPRVDVHWKTRKKRAERGQRLRRRQRPVFLQELKKTRRQSNCQYEN